MKFKRILIFISIFAIILSLTACGQKKKETKKENKEELVNILEQPDDYVGKFKVPESTEVESGSTLSIITDINENIDEIEVAEKTTGDDETILESFTIDCHGVNIEIYRCTADSPKLAEARDSGKISFYSAQGKLLAERIAAANGNYVIMFASSTNENGEDCSEKNNIIIEQFKSLDLK